MSVAPRDLLWYAGGECLERFGTLVWRPRHAMDRALDFTRAGSASFADKDGATRAASADRPRVEWVSGDPGLLLEASESEACSAPVHVPHDELTLYASLVERGNTGTAGVVQAGTLTGASDPRFGLMMSSSTYRGIWNNGVAGLATTPAPSAAPSAGNPFELLVSVSADGTVRFGQVIDGGAPEFAEASGGAVAGGSTLATVIHLNATGATNVGVGMFMAVKLARGVHSFGAMRAVFP